MPRYPEPPRANDSKDYILEDFEEKNEIETYGVSGTENTAETADDTAETPAAAEPASPGSKNRKGKLKIYEMTVFAMLGAIMLASKAMLDALPNIHLLGMLTMSYTLVYRRKALVPIYVYIMLNGLVAGFSLWWYPYLYLWAVLWGVTMLLPRDMPDKKARIVYPIVCSLHGLLFGTMYAPAQAIMFHLDFKGMIAWIVAGIPFDLIHAGGNLLAGFLILPTVRLLKKLNAMGDKIIR